MKCNIIALLAFVSLSTSISFAQIKAVEKGTLEAAEAFDRNQESQSEQSDRWNKSTKLTLFPLDKVPGYANFPAETLDPHQLVDGDIGYLERWQFYVMQISGPQEAFLEMRNPGIPPFCLQGYPTEKLADGEMVRIVGPVEVKGTKS